MATKRTIKLRNEIAAAQMVAAAYRNDPDAYDLWKAIVLGYKLAAGNLFAYPTAEVAR